MNKLKSLVKNKWVWLLVLILLSGGGYYAYTQAQPEDVDYTTVSPENRSLTQTIEVAGAIDASEKATLRFPTSARLSWVGVEEGDWVEQWQSLATVDTRTLEKQLQQDFNNFEKSWRAHDQNIEDVDYWSNAGISDEFKRIVESSGFDLQNAAINVEIRDLAIRLSTLISPVSGLVVKIDQPFAGAQVSASDTIQIVNPETIDFRAVIDEEDIRFVNPGQEVELVIDSYSDETIPGLVESIDFIPSQSESGGTGYQVTIAFPVDNNSLKYRLGMNGTATIIIDKKNNILSVPIESIIFRDNQSYVEVLNQEVKEMRPVTTGLESDDYIEIRDGLQASDVVVVPNGTDSD